MTAASLEHGVDLDALDLAGWQEFLRACGPTVALWPTAGKALGVSRPAVYRAAGATIPVLELGRFKRVATVWLIRQLQFDGHETFDQDT